MAIALGPLYLANDIIRIAFYESGGVSCGTHGCRRSRRSPTTHEPKGAVYLLVLAIEGDNCFQYLRLPFDTESCNAN